MQKIGSRTYFVFFAINLVGVLLVAVCFPETKGRGLEEMDGLFGEGSFDGTEVRVGMEGEVDKTGGVVSGKEVEVSGSDG